MLKVSFRGTRRINRQDRRERCPCYLEGLNFNGSSSSSLLFLRLPGNSGCNQSWSAHEVESSGTIYHNGRLTGARILCSQVRRSRDGRAKVSTCATVLGYTDKAQFRSLRPLVISLIPGQEKQLDRLKKMRHELQKEVCETIDEFGPKLYEDFDDVSIYWITRDIFNTLAVENATTYL